MKSPVAPRQHSFLFTFLCNIAIGVCLTLGLTGFVGWHFDIDSLVRVGPDHAPISYDTSISFLLVGASLWTHCFGLRALSYILASAVGAFNLLLLLQVVFDFHFGLEKLIPPSVSITEDPARLSSPLYAVCGFLLCYAAYMTGKKLGQQSSGVILLLLGASILTIGLITLVGYGIDLQLSYTRSPFINTAPHVSIGFVVLGIVVMFASLEKEIHYWLPATLTLCGLLLTLTAFAFMLQSDRRTLAATFQLDAQNIASTMKEELKSKTAVVGALRAFFDSSVSVERHEFKTYVSSLLKHHPGIQALEWVPVVSRDTRAFFEEAARRDGVSDFEIKQLTPKGALELSGQKDFYYPVYFFEPQQGNESILGFDLASEATRFRTLEEARDSGQMIATPMFNLIHGPQYSPSIQVIFPVYKKAGELDSLTWRRDNIEGWVIAVFKIVELFKPTTSRVDVSQIDLRVYEGSEVQEEKLIYRLGEASAPAGTIPDLLAKPFSEQSLVYVMTIDLLRQDWLVVISPTLAYVNSRGSSVPWIILVGGVLSTIFLLALLVHFVISRKSLSAAKLQLERENSERRRAEATLASERERLNVTLRSIGDGVIATDPDGRIVLINQIAESLTGWPESEALGKDLAVVLHLSSPREESDGGTAELIKKARIRVAAGESMLESKDGTKKVVAHSAAPIEGPAGVLPGMVLVLRDVTAAKKTEADLLRAQKLESVGVLAGGIAHDFNNILSGIMGSISVARSLSEDGGELQSRLVTAEKACLRARSLTQQLLTFSKGGAPIKKVVVLGELLHDVTSLALGGSDVACQLTIDEGLWTVDADEGQLVQVINNLVINAEQATPGSGTIEVEAKNIALAPGVIPVLSAGAYVMISVRDRGSGISPTNLPKIFDPYFTTKNSGSGLGLTAVHSIVRNHGGHVSVESAVGKGSVFTVYLPASRRAVPRQGSNVIDFPAGRGKILVVDDEDLILDVASGMLSHLGYQAKTAKSGQEAISLYKEAFERGSEFDAVILDLTLPADMDGKEIARRILQVSKNAKIVVSSGYSNDQVVSDYRAYGFCHVLSKPYGIQTLGEVLKEILARDDRLQSKSINL